MNDSTQTTGDTTNVGRLTITSHTTAAVTAFCGWAYGW